MKRIFLYPLVPAIAWSQQAATTTQAPMSEAETALRARVGEFYQLLVDKKFRQAESLVVEDSKDMYYNWGKPDIKGFDIKVLSFWTAIVQLKWQLPSRCSWRSQAPRRLYLICLRRQRGIWSRASGLFG